MKKTSEDELKLLNLKSYPSRWNIIYNKIIRIDKEINDELIYYNLLIVLIQNIRNSKKPYEILSFLKSFMNLYSKLPFKNDSQNVTKKFILIGLSNCEYVDKISPRNFLEIFDALLNLSNNLLIWNDYINNKVMNPQLIYNGKLHQSILKYAQSKLAKNSFNEIFGMNEIPFELEKKIFSDNIEKYICYFPYSSRSDIERTIKKFSIILINSNKDKKIINADNEILDELLYYFVNIVIRKFIFGHEHKHIIEGLLFFLSNKIGEKINYFNSEAREDRGELFELKCYGKIFNSFNLFDLIFMLNEKYDDLNVNDHLQEFKKYLEKNKDFLNELNNFPKDQILSEIVHGIYKELSKENKISSNYNELSNKIITFKT